MKIDSYTTKIEDDYIIDYVFISLHDNLNFILTIDSTGENINFISQQELESDIERGKIKYIINTINVKGFIKKIEYKYSNYDELSCIDFFIDKKLISIEITGIGLGVTCQNKYNSD